MHALGDELAITDKPLDYNSIVTTLVAKENLTIGEVYSQLLIFEQRLELQRSTEHYTNVATRGHGSMHDRGAP
jgi:hypothetical protein